MRAILVISSILVLANARPDVGQGYKYDTPQDTYQGAVPDPSTSYQSPAEQLPNFVPVQAHSGPALPPIYPDEQQPDNFIPTGPSNVQLQGVPSFGQTAPQQENSVASQALTTGSEAYRNSNDQQQQLLATSYEALPLSGAPQQQQQQQSSSFSGNTQQQSSFSSSTQQQSSFGSNFQQQSVSSSFSQDSQSDELPPIITKHFYVHAAPEEPEESEGPRFVNIGRKQKNYKIIFIKAPTYGFNSQVIPIVQPNEEKTIVYVLSKKPSFNQDVSLPPVPVTEPSKPEVFFIKYKTDREAQEAQQKIQGAYESDAFKGSNDNIINTVGNAGSGFQNQGISTNNNFAGSAVSNQFRAASNDQSETNEEHEEPAGASENTISANLLEAQSPPEEPAVQEPEPEEPQQQQQQQQQPPPRNEVHEEYLPPKH